MTLQQNIALLDTSGFTTLRGTVTLGVHGMPQPWLDAYDELVGLVDQKPPAAAMAAPGATSMRKFEAEMAMQDWQNARDAQADQLARQLGMDRNIIIETFIAESLGEHLQAFAADLKVLGPHAGKVQPDNEVVAAASGDAAFGAAWARYIAASAWYSPLHRSWMILRGNEQITPLSDPHGANSGLAEVRNLAEIRPDDWRQMRAYGQGGGSLGYVGPQVWPNAVHTRLAAILRDGGQVWMPSERQQTAAYAPHVPEAVHAYAQHGMDPRLAIWTMAGRRPPVA